MGTTRLEFPEKTAFLMAKKLEDNGINVPFATEQELIIRNRDRKIAFALIRRAGQFFIQRDYQFMPIN